MILFSLVLLNEINQSNNETNYEIGNQCDNETFLEEGFTCCNFTVCDKYCYKNICIPPNKIWFCTQIAIFWCFLIKHFHSFIFMIFGILIRIYYKSSNQIGNLVRMYILVLFNDLLLWLIINSSFCVNYFEVWDIVFIFSVIFYNPGGFAINILFIDDSEFYGYNLYEIKKIPEELLSYPKSRKIRLILNYFIAFITLFFNLIIIVDFFIYIISNDHRERWKKYTEIKENRKRENGKYIILS